MSENRGFDGADLRTLSSMCEDARAAIVAESVKHPAARNLLNDAYISLSVARDSLSRAADNLDSYLSDKPYRLELPNEKSE